MTGKSVLSVAAGLLCVAALCGCAGKPVVTDSEGVSPIELTVEQFGAIGDGVQDDAPAVLAAVDALRASGGPAKLLFSPGKTYRLGRQDRQDAQFDLSGLADIVVDGQGATLVLHPVHGLARMHGSRNLAFKNFVVRHDPLPFTQGTITAVHPDEGRFLLRIHDGYPLPAPEEWMQEHGHFLDNPASALPGRAGWADRNGDRAPWQWGVVMEAERRRQKKNFINHLFIEAVAPEKPAGGRIYSVRVSEGYKEPLETLLAGERFVMPVFRRTAEEYFAFKDKGWMFEQNVQIRRSSEVTVENLTFYSARPGMVFGVRFNNGPVAIRGCGVTWQPGTDTLIASWRDGIHCKNNRIGPVIENCRFEGLFDDSINLSADAVMAKTVIAPDHLVLTDGVFEAGDEAGVFHPLTGMWETGIRILRTEGSSVVLDRPVEGLVPGTMTPREDIRSTQFYNLSRANRGFVVRNCFFGPQRRHAVLARSPGGLIEDNVIDGISGCALELTNEAGNFYEGPFPLGVTIRNNRISDTDWPPVVMRTKNLPGVPPVAPVTGDILFENNEIVFDDGAPVRLECVRDVVFAGNAFRRSNGSEVPVSEAVRMDAASMDIQFR